ncbi:putative lanp [Cardiosporidium cionae]|uniref:Lanp n=1 Tax=Cardiosporidium cionae TaxID=476202 RepID=A0ABQ7JAB8_9APIC|nr:putative lanp [Cardiosporidium cionae]|eukprot:KAF8820905.1 putative lanp [Cardiosporidium cionae]
MEKAIHDRLKSLETLTEASVSAKSNDEDNRGPVTKEICVDSIEELILDGRKIREITPKDAQLLQTFKNLSKLTCNRTSLLSIGGFLTMSSIKFLELTDNHLHEGLESLAAAFPNLKRLELGGNYFKTLADIKPLHVLSDLEWLGLEMNPIAETPNYRESVFECLPKLQILDRIDRQGVEFDDEYYDEDMDDEDAEGDITLKNFYEKDYEDKDDDEDDGDFEPGEDEDDEVIEGSSGDSDDGGIKQCDLSDDDTQ